MKRTYLKTLIFISFSGIVFSQQSLTDTIGLDEVVVTGSKIEVARKNVPLSVSVVDLQEIENSDETNILPVISSQVPGVFVTERGMTGFGVSDGAAGQINIRGLGGSPTTQNLILIDGHPQFMGMMGHPLPDAYASSDVEKVEIIRGPASILYGSNAFGGVINIITRKQKTDGYSVHGKLSYGSFNTYKTALSGGFRNKGFNAYASVNHNQTDGHRDSSDFSITNAYLKTGYDINKKLKVYADVSIADFESADPGPEDGVAGDTINITRGKASFSLENNMGMFDGALKLYYNFGEHDITDGWHSNDKMYGIMVYQSVKPFTGNSITIGYDYMNYGGKGSTITTVLRDDDGNLIMGAQGPQFQLSEYNDKWVSMQNNALYLSVKQSVFEKLTVNAGVRYELNEVYGDEFIPQAGFALNLVPATTFKGSVSKGYRPPSVRELYLFPPANDDLKPERMMNYEVSWLQQFLDTKIKTEVTVYTCNGDNLIISVPFSAPPPPIYRNTGSFKNSGIEFSGEYHPVRNIGINANYAYIHMDEPLPFTPEHNLFVSGNYNFEKFSIYVSMQNITNLYGIGDDSFEITEKNYVVLGSKVKYQLLDYINVYISGNNLLNQDYAINTGYPMPGINFTAGLNINLNKDF